MQRKLFLFLLFMVVVLSVAVYSCKKSSSTGPPAGGPGTVSGRVQVYGGAPVVDAVVQLFAGNVTTGNPVATDSSDTTGQWQVTASTAGRHTIVVSKSGFPTAIVNVDAVSGQNVNVGNVTLSQATLSGVVNDAQTGNFIANAIVRFTAGTNLDTLGAFVAQDTTNVLGQWSLRLTLGNYVCVITAAGRVPAIASVPVNDTAAQQMTTSLTPPVPAGQMRIVLNWGAQPSDLDSHLTGDSTTASGQPRYHVFYANQVVTNAAGDTIAFLDLDDVTSYGPETITIYRFFPGTLRYKIHDYTNRNTFGSHYLSDSSRATVRVYTSAGQIREDHVITGRAGNQWHVYNIDGSTRNITFINTIRDSVSSPTDTSFRPTVLPEKKMQ